MASRLITDNDTLDGGWGKPKSRLQGIQDMGRTRLYADEGFGIYETLATVGIGLGKESTFYGNNQMPHIICVFLFHFFAITEHQYHHPQVPVLPGQVAD